MLLVIDNYDSFVHNLARHFHRLGQSTQIVRNDAITAGQVRQLNPDAIVLSPGPGSPDQAGNSLEIVTELRYEVPLLGVCLGHQVIAQAWGATIARGPQPIHGRASLIEHNHAGVLAELPCPLRVGRYHSLVVAREHLPDELSVTAWADDGTIMALEHATLPVVGLQFHPESVLTEHGYAILAAFLQRAALTVPRIPPAEIPADSFATSATPSSRPNTGVWPTDPITF